TPVIVFRKCAPLRSDDGESSGRGCTPHERSGKLIASEARKLSVISSHTTQLRMQFIAKGKRTAHYLVTLLVRQSGTCRMRDNVEWHCDCHEAQVMPECEIPDFQRIARLCGGRGYRRGKYFPVLS